MKEKTPCCLIASILEGLRWLESKWGLTDLRQMSLTIERKQAWTHDEQQKFNSNKQRKYSRWLKTQAFNKSVLLTTSWCLKLIKIFISWVPHCLAHARWSTRANVDGPSGSVVYSSVPTGFVMRSFITSFDQFALFKSLWVGLSEQVQYRCISSLDVGFVPKSLGTG